MFSLEGRRVSVGLIVPKALCIINEKQYANIFAASKDCRASPQILRGKGLSRFIPSPDPTHVGASGTGSALQKIVEVVVGCPT